MSKLTLPLAAALVALGFAFGPVSTAEAQGIHYRSRGVHIDIGSPHGHYGRGYYGHPRSQYYRGAWGAGYHSGLHGRGHLHYYPPQVVPHYDHYDVIPGHYHYHRGGHYPW